MKKINNNGVNSKVLLRESNETGILTLHYNITFKTNGILWYTKVYSP